jgi:hypothetical protein
VPVAEQLGHERIGVGDFSADGVQDKNAVVGSLEKPAVADFRLANGNPESEVVGYALGDRDIHLARRFRCGKDTGTMSANVPKMPEGLHFELSDWCAGCARLVATRCEICAVIATARSDKRSRSLQRKISELYCSLFSSNSFGKIE